MVWVAASATETCRAPIEKDTERFFSPQTPSPKSTPYRLASSVTSVLAGQYVDGRKWTSASPSQLHTPSVGVELVTWRWLSTAALSATGSSKYTRIGMPTPTVCPSSGPMDGVDSVPGVTVVKVEDAVTSSSSSFIAEAVSV